METVQLPQPIQSFIEYRTGDAVFVVAPDYRIAYWDTKAEFLTGLKSEEVAGRPCYEVILGEREDGERFCSAGCSVMRMSEEGRPVVSYDMLVSSPSGGKRWVNMSTLSLACEDGTYLVHLMRDAQRSHETMEMAQAVIRMTTKSEATSGRGQSLPALTARQLEVLRLLSEGRSVKEIKAELHLSEATVRNHVRSLLQALGAHSQLEALAHARELGILNT